MNISKSQQVIKNRDSRPNHINPYFKSGSKNKSAKKRIKIGNFYFSFNFDLFNRFFAFLRKKITKRDVIGLGVIILCAVLVHFLFHWKLENGFFLFFALVSYVLKWDSRIAIAEALIGLLSIMLILAVTKEDQLAETIAVWVYFFLVIGVVGQIIEMKRKGE